MVKDHLVDPERMARIEAQIGDYLHAARRILTDQFGPEVGPDYTLAVVELASAMAELEAAEIVATSQDRIARIIEESVTIELPDEQG